MPGGNQYHTLLPCPADFTKGSLVACSGPAYAGSSLLAAPQKKRADRGAFSHSRIIDPNQIFVLTNCYSCVNTFAARSPLGEPSVVQLVSDRLLDTWFSLANNEDHD